MQFPLAASKGGMTRYVLGNWKWMDKTKFQCDFVTMNKHLDFEKEILLTGSKIFHISCYAEEDQEQFIKEFEEILKEDYDVVHLHTKYWKSFLMEELCKKHHVPKVIVHAHATDIINIADPIKKEKELRIHEQVKKKFCEELATDFWACSELAADFLFGEQIARDKIRIMPNAIEISKFTYNQKNRDFYRKKYGLENSFVIGHVGRFGYAKNHEFLLRVFNDVLKRVNHARLLLLGTGELFTEVREYARTLQIEDKILFLGRREDIYNWYQAMDVFCLPSRMEGFPMVLVEAQAAGLPCGGSMAITQEVEISENMVRLPLLVSEWVKWILNCYSTVGKRSRMQTIDSKYDIQNQIKVIQEMYSLSRRE